MQRKRATNNTKKPTWTAIDVIGKNGIEQESQ